MSNAEETIFNQHGQEIYKDTREPVWPHRLRELSQSANRNRDLVEDSRAYGLLQSLDELEKRTRPSGGFATAENKDLAAFRALLRGGDLVSYVAGWAIDHQIGVAAQKNMTVDRHKHEKTGARERGEKNDPAFIRECLINLLQANSGGWPEWLCQHTLEAIEGLKYGEVSPVFAPVKRKKRSLLIRRLELNAVAMVAFRRIAYDMDEKNARDEVAGVLGVGGETIKSWQSLGTKLASES
jgi:hypothetical protein